jgi:hypothetical protein
MSQQPAAPSSHSGFNRAVPWLLAIYLIGNFLWRAFTPAHEYPPRSVQVFEMILDGVTLLAMFGVRKRIPVWLFALALIAGLGLFAIRLHSDASWWTGHYMYWLPPR